MAEQKLFSMAHEVNYYECDPSGRISLSSLIALMILASEKQNKTLGVDEDITRSLGGGWVIIDYEAHFDQPLPRDKEQIDLQTKLLGYNKFFAVRQLLVRNAQGELIGSVNGLFIYMDLQKRKMARIPEEIMAPYELDAVLKLPKVQRPDHVEWEADWNGHEYRVRYFDIDINGHVNNARYFDWMLDTLNHQFLLNHQIVDFRMNYEHEVRPETTVVSYSSQPVENADHQLVTQHKIFVGEDECAAATITWRKC
ncbi:acyl-[acyl-carrier-protein] thioesterase [Limosilactobacillus caecicola]|uniref:acyl-[acyl-carrier-protein] thioesterase n=1 Tax=Limosilactobacillus caecicola TaxID=2941332 RepID=UPI00203A6428|nr:acyl-ACP thioesterase domain-containing protein [Limosilactobacillus caecicola]